MNNQEHINTKPQLPFRCKSRREPKPRSLLMSWENAVASLHPAVWKNRISSQQSFMNLLYIQCGDPQFGFARIRCKECGAEYLRAFSCKCRGFSVHCGKPIEACDDNGRKTLSEYISRAPFSLERMSFNEGSKTVVYRGEHFHPTLARNFDVKGPLEWIARKSP